MAKKAVTKVATAAKVENAVKSCKWFSFAANGNVAIAMKNGK